jgi:hypothetical protein
MRLAVECQSSRSWLYDSADCIEESCLSGTIWTDEAHHLIALESKEDIIECSQTAEFNGEV